MVNLHVVKGAVKTGAKYLIKHSPTILTIIGTGMMGGAIVHGIIEAPKAKDELDDLENDGELSHKEYLQKKIHILFYHYWMTTALGLGGAALIFWSHHVTLGQTATAIAAYNMKADQLEKLEKKIVDTDGEKHLNKIKDEIVKDAVSDGPKSEKDIFDTGKGKTLCYEVISGRYFYSDIEKIRKAMNDINTWINDTRRYDEETDVSLNEWFEYLGLERTKVGNKLGWHDRLVELNFTSVLTNEGEPCLCVGYKNPPVWDFDMPISERNICSDDWCDRAPTVM